MNIYDEAIQAVIKHYSLNNVINALERAKKEHELLGLYQKRFSFYNFDSDKDTREIKRKEKELEEEIK